MKRRIIWKYGDSSPLYGQIIAAVEGDGDLNITVGFPVSAVEVSFSKSYATQERLKRKDYSAHSTSADGDFAITEALERTSTGNIIVAVNGLIAKITESYFTRPGSTTPITDSPKVGDRLRWVGSVAGYELATTDTITLINTEEPLTFGYDYQNYTTEPEVFVSSINSEGFVLGYKNIAGSLEVNYFVM